MRSPDPDHRDALLGAEREPLDDFHPQAGARRRRRGETPQELQGHAKQRQDESQRGHDPQHLANAHATFSGRAMPDTMRVMRTPKWSPNTTTSPSAKRRSLT